MVGEVKPSPNHQLLALALAKFPHLQQYASQHAVITAPDPGDGRQLETYPPDESWNPIPGKWTTELYNTNAPQQVQQNLIAGDMLHHIGAMNPDGTPVSQQYYALKEALLGSLTPQQKAMDQQAYQQQAKYFGGNPPPFDQWMQNSRGDEYIMGMLAPDAQDQWRDVYTPQQRQIGNVMLQYLNGTYKPGAR
jgi:hypothetical protein